MDHENNSDSKNLFPLQDEVWSDPPRRPLTPEEVEAALARNEAYYAPLIAAEKARKAAEKNVEEKA